MRTVICIAALLLACASPGHCQPPNYLFPDVPDNIKPRHRALVREVQLGKIIISLESTSISELMSKFPGLEFHHRGDAGDAESWTCFLVDTPGGRLQVWPSAGEIEGEKYINSVIVETITSSNGENCPLINIGRGPVGIGDEPWIGWDVSEIRRRLGKPSMIHGPFLLYSFEVPLADSKGGECEVGGELVFKLERGRVSKLWVSKTTAC